MVNGADAEETGSMAAATIPILIPSPSFEFGPITLKQSTGDMPEIYRRYCRKLPQRQQMMLVKKIDGRKRLVTGEDSRGSHNILKTCGKVSVRNSTHSHRSQVLVAGQGGEACSCDGYSDVYFDSERDPRVQPNEHGGNLRPGQRPFRRHGCQRQR